MAIAKCTNGYMVKISSNFDNRQPAFRHVCQIILQITYHNIRSMCNFQPISLYDILTFLDAL